MKVEYADKRLELIKTDRAAETKLPISVINSCRKKIAVMEAAPDDRTLRNWKSLHYEKLSGDREGQRSIRLNEGWRMVFTMDTTTTPPTITVLEVENHYKD